MPLPRRPRQTSEASWQVGMRQADWHAAMLTQQPPLRRLLAAAGDHAAGAPPAAQAEAPPADLGSLLANVGTLLGVNGLQLPASNGQSEQQSVVDWGIMLNQMPPVGSA